MVMSKCKTKFCVKAWPPAGELWGVKPSRLWRIWHLKWAILHTSSSTPSHLSHKVPFPQQCPFQWEVLISWCIGPVPLSCLKIYLSRAQQHTEVWCRISRCSLAVLCWAVCSMLQVSASCRGTGRICAPWRRNPPRRNGRHVFLAPKMLVVFTKSDTSAQL